LHRLLVVGIPLGQVELSILPELHRGAGGGRQVRRLDSFQFFLSCIREARAAPPSLGADFQFFLSCIDGLPVRPDHARETFQFFLSCIPRRSPSCPRRRKPRLSILPELHPAWSTSAAGVRTTSLSILPELHPPRVDMLSALKQYTFNSS